MRQTRTFKCPCCGGYLEFDPSMQKFKCLYCGQVLSQADVQEPSAEQAADTEPQRLRGYHCQNCGAEIITDDTTAATRCYYCHSPVVLQDRLSEEFRPDGVIPFQLDKKAAEEQFLAHLRKKKFLDRDFFNGAQLEMFSGVYFPWWVADIEGEGVFDGEGTKKTIHTTPREVITTTEVFRVHREGKLSFRQMARKALMKADGKLSDGIHPYDLNGLKPYAGGYLSGFLADKRDVPEATAKAEMVREATDYAQRMMKQNCAMDTLSGETRFTPTAVRQRYVLLPAWVLTYRGGKDREPYYYMMNGQTGRVCGRLPIDKKRLLAAALCAGAAVFLLLCGGGAFLW